MDGHSEGFGFPQAPQTDVDANIKVQQSGMFCFVLFYFALIFVFYFLQGLLLLSRCGDEVKQRQINGLDRS